MKTRRNNMAIRLLDEPAARHPSKVAVLDSSGVTRFADVAEHSRCAASALVAAGCRPGDRVLIALADSSAFVEAFFGCVRAGLIAVPVSVSSLSLDFALYLSGAMPRAAVADGRALPELKRALRNVPYALEIIYEVQSDAEPPWRSDSARTTTRSDVVHAASPDDPAAILYTSGSTGRQKATLHSHHGFIAAAEAVGRAVFELNETDTVLCMPKLTFSFGLGFGMCFPLSVGALTVLGEQRRELEGFGKLVMEHRPTVVAAVPSTLAAVLRAARSWLAVDLSSVRYVVSAGEPLPLKLADAFKKQFRVPVLDGMGSTEMLTHFITNRPGRQRRGSCGYPVPGCEASLRDDDGTEVEEDEVGTLWINAPTKFLGYWSDGEGTDGATPQGWFCTKDQLRRDADGFFYYVGRADDMLKVSGLWVSSAEVEAAAEHHQAVERAVVTTREDPMGVRRLILYVVPKNGSRLTGAELLRHLSGLVAEHMLPVACVALDSFPLTANGKVQRAHLPDPSWTRGVAHAME
jgi:acyl-coenzyme A synthetase/AMP-(fatty) acid ligase